MALFWLATFLAFAVAEEVVTLTSETFDDFVTTNPKVLVEFYAPWCGHCKALAPEYEKAAKTLNEDEAVQTILAKVDATTEKELASRYEVRGFPTLKFFNGAPDKYSDYGGGRTEDTIVSWIRKRELPAVTSLKSKDEVESFQSKGRVVLVGYFSDDGTEFEALKSVANDYRDNIIVGQVSSEDVAKESGADFPSLVLYRDFDDSPVAFTGKVDDVSEISEFVESERFPLIDMIGPENYADYVKRGLPLVWIAVDPSKEEEKNGAIEACKEQAARFKGKLSFTWVDAVQFEQHVQNLGITNIPGLIVINESDKYLFQEELNAENLKSFFDKYEDGSLEKFLKSQEVPESNDEPVFVLVGKNFYDVVGKDKDVFVEFYAPWCGHCKRLAPDYEKVGQTFKDVSNLVVAKIDATENDTNEQITGFPTLIFYPKGTTEGVKYSGERTAASIVSWLKEKASEGVDLSAVDDKVEL